MTISSSTRKAGPFTGNGTATTFPFTFKVFQASDLLVVRLNTSTFVESTLVLNTDYTVALNQNQNTNPGGSIVLGSVLATGFTLTATSDIQNLQPTDLTNQGGFYPTVINDALDRATIQIQQIQEEVDRSLKYPISDPVTGAVLPPVGARASKVLAFDALTGEPIAGPSIGDVATMVGNLADIHTVATDIANVNIVAADKTNIDAVAGDLTNINAVAGDLTNINAVKADLANIDIAAGNVTDINNFADVYQGAKATDPTLRNNGSALHAGDMYFNTTVNEIRAYSGTVWVAGTAGAMAVQRFDGTGSATAFTLATAPAGENNTQVYINGVYQQKDSYAVSGVTLTFDSAPPAGTGNIEVVTISTLALGATDAALVSTTTGTGGLWSTVQGFINRIVSSIGSSIIGFIQAGAGAVLRTVQDKLREEVTPYDFGAVGDGVANDTTALQNWATCGVKNKHLAAGTYKVNAAVTLEDGSIVRGDGESSVIDASSAGAGFSGSYVLGVVGTLTALPALASNTSRGNSSFVFSSAPTLAPNDVVLVYDPTNSSWSTDRTYYRAGEFAKVRTVSGTTANLWTAFYAGYTAAVVNIYKLSGKKVVLENFVVKGATESMAVPVWLSKVQNSRVEGVHGYNSAYCGMVIDKSFDVTVSDGLLEHNATAAGENYGIVLSNSQNITVQGKFYATRHAVSIGGDDLVGCVPCRNLKIHDSVLAATGGSVPAADVHGNVEDIHYENCKIYGGITFGGKNVQYKNCSVIANETGNGVCAYASEVVGGYQRAIGCDFTSYGTPGSSGRGVLDFGRQGSAFTSSTKETSFIEILDCSVTAPSDTGGWAVTIANNGSVHYINVNIDNLRMNIPSAPVCVEMKVNSGSSYSEFIKVDNLSGLPSGCYILSLPGGAYSTTPLRLQKQSGRLAATATTGTAYTVAGTVTFRNPYPKTPSARAMFTGGGLYNGNRAVYTVVNTLTNTAIGLCLESGDATNWTATANGTVCWEAGFEDF